MTSPDWHTDEFPELRDGPPWVMQEMIAAQPELVEKILRTPPADTAAAAQVIAGALQRSRPIVVCGCGTSEHAAHAVAALLWAAVEPERAPLVQARAAMSAALDPSPGVCVAVSHDGETRATTLALTAARDAGADTMAITCNGRASVAAAAEHVVITPYHDESWCHTVAYTSALAAGATLAGAVGELEARPHAARQVLEHATNAPGGAQIAERLADRRVVLCVGAQADHITARELALKIAEGARLPTLALELETVLHGQLAGHEPGDALILVAITDHPGHERIARRAEHAARAAREIGLPVAALLSAAYDQALAAELTPAGRLVTSLPDHAQLNPKLAGLLAGAGALQTVTLQLAHARQTNPDLIRREEAPYRQAAHAAEDTPDW
jgi:glucosamine--fructose-6-phosphate aminotransferase (isomerizing)